MIEIVLDTETTGLSVKDGHRIVEIGCVELNNQIPTKRFFHCLLNPERKVSEDAFKIHGYSDEFLSNKKKFSEITKDFLEFSKARGNDLSTPRPEFNFPGVKEGDSWCLCAERWAEAYESDMAPKLYIKRTHLRTLDIVPLEILKKFAIDLN